ncbi:MAG: SBBP repeat-containing protein [Acidobacteria bacterium]|nr:SBBP repeat-containing protein [Acidobacteriota bacterium]
MKWTYFALAAFVVGACGLAGSAGAQGSAAEHVGPGAVPDARRLELAESYGRSPLRFEANQGQTDGRVRFLSRGNGYALFLTPTEAVLTLRTPAGSGRDVVLRMKLLGSDPVPTITGEEELPGRSNYFIGHDPKRWRTRVPNYGRARFAGVYPGVDLVFYGDQRQLEYDFVVAPGADPSSITLGFAGADSLQIGPQGELSLQVRGSEVTWRKPVVYQEVDGVRQMVVGRYVRKGKMAVGFEVAPYDRRQPLILDPVLAYSTYLGGSDTDEGHGIAVDSSGNAYVTGVTYSTDFPAFPATAFQTVLGGNRDAFVTKLDAGGSLGYSTYMGGSNVSGLPSVTEGAGIAVDLSGDAYLTGRTNATDFPTTPGVFQATNPSNTLPNRAFVTKLNAAGDGLIYSTYVGGTSSEVGSGIAVDYGGNAYVVGSTFSSDFPTLNAFQAARASTASDVFVTKLNGDGSALLYSTYLGGDGHDSASAIAVDDFGNAYVTGRAGSSVVIPFPTTANAYRTSGGTLPFLAKFDTHASGAASLPYSSFIGDSLTLGIAADGSGNVYLVGRALSNFPTTVGAFQPSWNGGFDAFVARFNLNASGPASLVYATFLGGAGDEEGHGIALDSSGDVYVTGYTNSRNFPTVNAIQSALGGGVYPNVFVAKLNAGGTALVHSTYLGGSALYGDTGHAIAVDHCGNAYVTGVTYSADFPLANAMQATFGGGSGGDAFVAKIEEARPGLSSITVTPANPTMATGGSQQFTATGCIDNRLEDLTSLVTWSSATSSVATIDMGGLATGVGAGTSVVTAASGGITGSATLTVRPPFDYGLSASPATLELPAPSSTRTSTVALQSRNGASETVDLTAAWVGAAPSGATFALSPARVTVPSTGSVAATLTLRTSASPSQGTFALRISGKSASGVMRSLDLSVVIGATLPAPTCACTETGDFKDPRVEGLETSSPFATVTPALPPSSDPLPSVPPAFAPLTLTRNSDGKNIVTGATNVSAFGFSPNGKYFVLITYVSSSTGPLFSLTLYSVDAGGQVGPEVQNPLSWGFSPDDDNEFFLVASSDGLSTHVDLNIYDAATGRQVMTERATAYTSFGNPPWTDKQNVKDNDTEDNNNDKVGGWGFSPDGNTFVLSYRTSVSAYVLSLWNLARTPSALPSENRLDVASFWQFSPCGDLLMLVSQAGASPGPSDQVYFRHTSEGSPYQQPSLDPSRGAPSATVVSNPGGGYDIQLTGMDRSSISSPQCSFDYAVSASPPSLALIASATRTSMITLQSGDGTSKAVDLTAAWVGAAPSGVTFALSPARVTVPSTGSVSAILTLRTSASPSQGAFALKITGRSATGVTRALDLSVVIGATLPAPTCGCTNTGPFKDPRVKGLVASSPLATVTPALPPSSDPLPSVPPAFDPLTLTRNSDGRHIVTGATSVSAFGFSPNGKYFVLITYISSATGPVFYLTLYSVQAGGQVGPEVANPLSWGFSPDGDNEFFLVASSDGLSTHVDLNIYDAATGRQVMADRATAYTSFGNPPWTDKQNVKDNDKDDSNNDHVGGWGFSPDGNTFVLSYRTSQSAYVLSLWNLARSPSALSSENRLDVASFWQFSPCGDLFMLVSQAGANPGPSDQVIFRHTSNGNSYVQPSLDPSRGAPSATVVSNPGGGYDIQLTGMDRSSISSPQCTTAVTLHSPANIALMDAAGRRTGFDPQAGVLDQIPGGTYTGAGSEPQTVAIPYVAGSYLVDAFGLDTLTSPEPYRLTIVTTDAAGDVFDQAEVSGTAARGSLDTFAFSVGGGPLTLDLVSGDMTPPDIRCAQPDGRWHAGDVSLACSAADARSGLADPMDASFSLSTSVSTGIETSDAMTGSRRVCDSAGNCANAGPIAGNMVDRRAPTIAISAPSGTYLVGEDVVADYSCADGGSGVASCTGPVVSSENVDTTTVGTRTFTVAAADNAGNSATATSTYDVVYDFVGFFQPIDNVPALNIAAAGRSIPVKFSLGGNQGLTIIAAGFPASSPIPCDASEPGTGLEESATPGGNSLSYDVITDQYSYIWKTKKAWKGTCRMLVVGLNDGTQHYARFRIR